MANLAVNDLLKVTFYCKNQTQVSQNVCYYVVDGVVGVPVEQEVADNLSVEFAPEFKAVLSSTASYEGLRLQRIHPIPTQGVTTKVDAGTGILVGDALPPQACGLIRKVTDTPGRKGRGRFYVPFASESESGSGGKPSATYLTALAGMRSFIKSMTGIGSLTNNVTITGCVLTLKPTISLPRRITATTVNSAWATQRRRSFVNRGDNLPL